MDAKAACEDRHEKVWEMWHWYKGANGTDGAPKRLERIEDYVQRQIGMGKVTVILGAINAFLLLAGLAIGFGLKIFK